MKFRLLSFALIATLLIPLALEAQDLDNPLFPARERTPTYLGPIAGFNRSMHSVDMPSFAKDALCPQFSDGNNNGYYFGLSYERMFSEDNAMSNQSIIVRVFYSNLPASFEEGGDKYPSQVPVVDENGQLIEKRMVESSVLHTNEITYNVISAEVAYKINPFDGFNLGFTIGPTFDYAMSATQDQRLELVEPLNASFVNLNADGDPTNDEPYTYTNNDRTIIIQDGDVPDASSYRIGIRAGVQYEINLAGGWYAVPAMYYNFALTNLNSDFDWRVNALQIGIDLRYALVF